MAGFCPVIRCCRSAEVPLPGAHLRSRRLAAALGARLAGIPGDAIAQGIRSFRGVPHRLETIGEPGRRALGQRLPGNDPDRRNGRPGGVRRRRRWSSSPGEGEGARLRRGGGRDRGSLPGGGAHRRTAPRSSSGSGPVGFRCDVPRRWARRWRSPPSLAQAGDVVLLSPAAASFDMFTDYAARGDAFRRAVEPLADAARRGRGDDDRRGHGRAPLPGARSGSASSGSATSRPIRCWWPSSASWRRAW